jgi:Protein of unknown function (DUF3093)
MRVYHERMHVPFSWWLIGLITIILLATEVIPGWPVAVQVMIYVVLVGGVALLLVNWGRLSVDVGAGELRAGRARLPLTAIGEVTALDEAQTRALRGPRADPAAYLMIRPYLRHSVYVEVASPQRPAPPPAVHGNPLLQWRQKRRWHRLSLAADAPYWLVGTRHPAALAAAIHGPRPAARTDGATMG